MTTPTHLSEEEIIRIGLDRINRNSTYGIDPNNHPLVDEYRKIKAQRNAMPGNSPIVGSIYHDSSCNTESINPGECVQQQVLVVNSDTDEILATASLTPEDANIVHQLSEPIPCSLSTKPLRDQVAVEGIPHDAVVIGSIYPGSFCNSEPIDPEGCTQLQFIICNSDTDKALAEHVLTPEESHAIHHCDYISNNDISFMYPHRIKCIDVGVIVPSVKSVFDKWYIDLIEQIAMRAKYRERIANRRSNKKTYRYKRRK